MRIAVLDLGSTSFHVSVFDVDSRGQMERVLRRRVTLHLSASVARCGHLPEDLCAKAVRAVRTLRRAADRAAPDLWIGVATSALREAANGGGLIERLEAAALCPIRVLTGHEEARLAYHAAREVSTLRDVPLLVFDLGGGSLDVAMGQGPTLLADATFPLGASRLHATLVRNDPASETECYAIADLVREHVRELRSAISEYRLRAAVATGGTARALARLHVARSGRPASPGLMTVVPAGALASMTSLLTRLSRKERLELPAVRSRRVDVLPVGAIVLSTLIEELDLGALNLCEWGLREGLVLETVGRLPADGKLVAAGSLRAAASA